MRPAAALLLPALLASGPPSHAQTITAQPGRPAAAPSVTLERAPTASAPVCVLPAGSLPTRTRAVFLLDTSGSMRGIGDGRADIFERVKGAVNAYVRARRPDRVDLVTFDGGLRSSRGYALPGDAGRWNSDLAALRADGQNTYLYRSVAQALAPLAATPQAVTTVFLLTDGIDNDPDPAQTAARALGAFRARGPLDTLHYVALGTGIPAEARAALGQSGYAGALTVPVGGVPDLAGTNPGGAVLTVTDPARVPVPFADGTPLNLAVSDGVPVSLAAATVQGGGVALEVGRGLPHGTPALLCAPSAPAGGPPRRVLLRLNVGPLPGLTLLNPGADRALRVGESVTLRYRLDSGLNPGANTDALALSVPPGLTGELLHLPSGREVGVRLTRTSPGTGAVLTPRLTLADGRTLPLASITGQGSDPVVPAPLPDAAPSGEEQSGPFLPVLGGLLAAGLLLAGWLLWRRRRGGTKPRPASPLPAPPAAVEGIEYGDERTLALVGVDGLVTAVPTPLSGPFDLGQVARVPHLSGLRLEQDQGGLRVLRLPADLEVSQGARLLRENDVIRPGTLLGVAVARPARSPHPPLGSLIGLGLPLRLRADGVTLHVSGPYGDHARTLPPGITDLGMAFGAPALHGLTVTPSGPRILLAAVPARLTLRRPHDAADPFPSALRPGTYLPAEVELELPEG